MKPSIYNSLIELPDNKSFVYNALSDTFVAFLSSEILDKGTFVTQNPVLHGQLVDNGILVPDDKDEVQAVRDLITQIDDDPTQFHLHINPTLACNFRCWYCYEDHADSSYMNSETLDAVLALIRSKVEKPELKHMQLSFFGGEPLLHFDKVAAPLISTAAELCKERDINLFIHFTSNGYLLTSGIMDILSPLNVSFQITLDGHRESHNKVRRANNSEGSYDVIVRNVAKLLAAAKSVVLRINYTEETLKEIPSIIEDLKSTLSTEGKRYLTIDLQQVWQDIAEDSRERIRKEVIRLMDEIKSNGFHATAPIHCDSIRNSCYGDHFYHFLINYNGLVYFCTARDFTPGNAVGKITKNGEIEWDNEAYVYHRNIKFSREICQTCRIAPICGGGCRQKSKELEGYEECTYGYSEQDKDDIIMRRFQQLLSIKQEESV